MGEDDNCTTYGDVTDTLKRMIDSILDEYRSLPTLIAMSRGITLEPFIHCGHSNDRAEINKLRDQYVGRIAFVHNDEIEPINGQYIMALIDHDVVAVSENITTTTNGDVEAWNKYYGEPWDLYYIPIDDFVESVSRFGKCSIQKLIKGFSDDFDVVKRDE